MASPLKDSDRSNGTDATATLTGLQHIAGTSEHVELIASCLRVVEVSCLSRQLDVLDDLLAGHPGREVRAS